MQTHMRTKNDDLTECLMVRFLLQILISSTIYHALHSMWKYNEVDLLCYGITSNIHYPVESFSCSLKWLINYAL
jgi:ABC-type uncharacterized transport system permease subunit